jgi:GNAT superfamily N-acetyltransferase
MIEIITWAEILDIWSTKLWPNRVSPIQPNSAMCYLQGHDMFNMQAQPTFFAYKINGNIVGVNSGHATNNNTYRSRGLWVDTNFRNQGIGKQLLLATINQAVNENSNMIWSLPRQTSWNTYKSAGFELGSSWFKTETSDNNAYCFKKLL